MTRGVSSCRGPNSFLDVLELLALCGPTPLQGSKCEVHKPVCYNDCQGEWCDGRPVTCCPPKGGAVSASRATHVGRLLDVRLHAEPGPLKRVCRRARSAALQARSSRVPPRRARRVLWGVLPLQAALLQVCSWRGGGGKARLAGAVLPPLHAAGVRDVRCVARLVLVPAVADPWVLPAALWPCSIDCSRSKVYPPGHSMPNPADFKIYM